ncbi:peroxisomal membrane protein 2 [Nannochloropsis gaditana]|uniref:Peroxisomal membrane protein 2 n=2 Tax=Nannochloropsis gaditana TaxID=72520 RepID=W7TTQ5_9STRA|nr:peroxisomal membrane protein 2 [Nannochloropsis gaditana]
MASELNEEDIPASAGPTSKPAEDEALSMATTTKSDTNTSAALICTFPASMKAELKRLLRAYHHCLVTRPVLTKALTSAVISALGDILASSGKGGRGRSGRRTLGFFLFGGLVTGPLCHYWYGLLEKKVRGLQGGKNVAMKVLLDKLLFTPPFLALTLFLLRLLESGRPGAAWRGMKQVYFPTLKTNLQVWTVAQAINFSYVSPAYRVLFGNLVALWWSFYLSRLGGGAGGRASSVVLMRKRY